MTKLRKDSRELKDIVNKTITGDVLKVLRTFPDKCIQTLVTSPPYW